MAYRIGKQNERTIDDKYLFAQIVHFEKTWMC